MLYIINTGITCVYYCSPRCFCGIPTVARNFKRWTKAWRVRVEQSRWVMKVVEETAVNVPGLLSQGTSAGGICLALLLYETNIGINPLSAMSLLWKGHGRSQCFTVTSCFLCKHDMNTQSLRSSVSWMGTWNLGHSCGTDTLFTFHSCGAQE